MSALIHLLKHNFAIQTAKIRSFSNAIVVSQYHMVEASQREAWEKYSVLEQGWVEESIDIMKQDIKYRGKIVEDYSVVPSIHNSSGEEVPRDDAGPLFPKWQSYPVVPTYPPFNWDGRQLTSLKISLPELVEKGRAVIGTVENIPIDSTDPVSIMEAQANTDFLRNYLRPGTSVDQPISDLYYPILADAADVISTGEDKPIGVGNHTVVAIFGLTFFWRDLLRNILPEGTHALVVVFENSCGQVFSYEVDGGTALFLGHGDWHDKQYDGMKRSKHLNDPSGHNNTYLGLPLSDEVCPYIMHVYPSAKLEDAIKNGQPVFFGVAAAAIFIFTTIVFLLYDSCVERRQVSQREAFLLFCTILAHPCCSYSERSCEAPNRLPRSCLLCFHLQFVIVSYATRTYNLEKMAFGTKQARQTMK